MHKRIEQVDTETGEVMDGCIVWIPHRPKLTKLMDAAAVVENLQTCPIGQLPKTESQARPLTRLEPEVQREVWQEVIAETPHEEITARVVEEKANSTNAALWAGLADKGGL